MRNGKKVETRRDRKALARDAGMGTVSVISVLAGALCALATFEILAVAAGAIGVGVNGGTSFAAMSDGRFKTLTAIIVVAALFAAFTVGGYVSGRMSRRGGATHGLVAGVVGVFLAALGVVAVIGSGADSGLARVARHINVADTWHQWRYFGLIGIAVAGAAMVLGGLAGGVKGEQWHGKLLARAVDPSYGREAEERALARKRITEAEVARLAAAEHVGRLTGAAQSTQSHTQTRRAAASDTVVTTAPRTTRVVNSDPTPDPATTDDAATTGHGRRPRHLLGRR